MSGYNFPNSPATGDVFNTYIWDGEKWRVTVNPPGGGGGGAGGLPSNVPPLMDGAASPGVSIDFSRGDHRHPSDTSLMPKTGGTFSGIVGISTANASLSLNKTAASAQGNNIIGGVNGVARWVEQLGGGETESGVATGSNYNLIRYDNAGNYIGVPLAIARDTGFVSMANNLNVAGSIVTVGNMTCQNFVSGANGGLYFGPSNTKYLVHDGVSTLYLAGSGLNVQAGGIAASGQITAYSDMQTIRAGNAAAGLIFFGNTGSSYLHFDATNYSFTHTLHAPNFYTTGGLTAGGVTATNISITNNLSVGNSTVLGNLTINGVTTFNSTLTATHYVTLNVLPGSIWQAGSSSLQITGAGGGYDAFIAFHRPGAFAVNFGLGANDNRLRVGGWSLGYGNWYKLWTEQDFTEAPVHNTRLVYVGDYVHSSDYGLEEPFGATACVTGLSGARPSGFGQGSWLTARYRQLQVRRADGYFNAEAG